MTQLQFSTSNPNQCPLDGSTSFDPGPPLPIAEGARAVATVSSPGAPASVPGASRDQITGGGDPFSFIEDVRAELEAGIERRGGALAGGDGPVRFGAAAMAVHRAGGIPVAVHGEVALGRAETQAAFEFFGQRVELEASASVLSADAGAGIVNRDGSLGFNLGASANLAAAETTVRMGAQEISAGYAEGVGADFSVGLRDHDGNGIPELCERVSVGVLGGFTVGGCVEVNNLPALTGVGGLMSVALDKGIRRLVERE